MVRYTVKSASKSLVSLSDGYDADGMYWFWPDLATNQNAKATLKVYREGHIAFIPKAASTHLPTPTVHN